MLTLQELVRALNPLVDIVHVLHFHGYDVRVGVVTGTKIEERTRLGERERGE